MGNVSAVDVGIDVGSTTTKICALDARSRNLLHTSYERHGARQAESVRAALNSLARLFPRAGIRLALTGSGAAPIADKLGVPFVQEHFEVIVLGIVAVSVAPAVIGAVKAALSGRKKKA